MMNAKKKIVTKWIINLGIVMLMGISNSAVLYGMEPEQPSYKTLPKELKQEIINTALNSSSDLYGAIKAIKAMSALHEIQYDNFKDITNLMAALENKFPHKSRGEIILALEKQELFTLFKSEKFAEDLRKKIQQSIAQDAIIFLSQQPVATLAGHGHTGQIKSVAIAGDPNSLELRRASKVVTGSKDKTAKIWDLNTGALLHTLKGPNGHSKAIFSVAIAGDKVVTGSQDNTAKIWDLNTGALLHTLKGPNGHSKAIFSVAIAGDKVVTGSQDNTAKIWDLNTGEFLHTLAGHMDIVSAVAITGNKIVTGSSDRTAKIWNLNTGALLHTLKGHTGWVTSIAIAGDKVVTGSADETAKIWDLNTGTLLHTLVGHTGPIDSVAVAGDKVMTGSDDNTAKIWNLKTGEFLHTLAGHTNTVWSVAIASDKVVTGSVDNTAKIWDLNTGQLLHTLAGHTDWVISVVVAGDKVVTGSDDSTAKIWSLNPLAGTPQDNPLVWIIHNATIPQLDLIKRAYEATIAKKEFIIAFPSEDAKVFLSLPMHVRQYLLQHLMIRR